MYNRLICNWIRIELPKLITDTDCDFFLLICFYIGQNRRIFPMKKLSVFLHFYIFILSFQVLGEKAEKGFNLTQIVGASINPQGILLTTQLFYRVPLTSKTGILWESTKFDAGINNDFSPAFENPGLFVRCEPVAFFELTLSANNIQLYKALGNGYVPLESASSPHDVSNLKNSVQSNAHGWWLRCTPVLKAGYKKAIIANATTIHHFQMNRNDYYLERFTNTALDNSDFVITNDLFFFYKGNKFLMTGVNYFYLTVPSSDERTHRISFAAIYLKKISAVSEFNVAFVGGTYLKHCNYDYKDLYLGLQLMYSYGFRKSKKG